MLLAARIFVTAVLTTWCAEKEVSAPDGQIPSPRRHLRKRWPGGRPRLSVLMGSLSVPMATPVARPQTVPGVVVR
uniref:Putative secreted protein n=1 Tax=Ixodes ricinus TaxID=34613 RepID=A0A6B0U3C1_IXORI